MLCCSSLTTIQISSLWGWLSCRSVALRPPSGEQLITWSLQRGTRGPDGPHGLSASREMGCTGQGRCRRSAARARGVRRGPCPASTRRRGRPAKPASCQRGVPRRHTPQARIPTQKGASSPARHEGEMPQDRTLGGVLARWLVGRGCSRGLAKTILYANIHFAPLSDPSSLGRGARKRPRNRPGKKDPFCQRSPIELLPLSCVFTHFANVLWPTAVPEKLGRSGVARSRSEAEVPTSRCLSKRGAP